MTADPVPQVDDPRHHKKYFFHQTVFRRMVVGTMRRFLPLFIRMEVNGLVNIPEDGPTILASNHLTNFDVFPLQMVIQRPLFFMAKSELFRNPILDAALRNLGAFPVQRAGRDPWAGLHALKVLEKDQVLAIFPEGSRSKGRGLGAGKTGAARFAIQAGCPIIPIAVNGTHQIFRGFPRRTRISILIGEPLFPRPGESTLSLTDRLMFSIADMLPGELKGVYAIRPIGFSTQ